jgi:hypothetical protein
MVDVFISYKRQERPRVAAIVTALRSAGFDAWSDSNMCVTANIIKEVNAKLDAAMCVVVVWSKLSVESNWVLDEAYDAFERKCLIPLRIDDVKIPVPFARIQTIDLRNWFGDTAADEWRELVDVVAEYCCAGLAVANPKPSAVPHRDKLTDLIDKGELDQPPEAIPASGEQGEAADGLQAARERVSGLLISTLNQAEKPIASAHLAHLVRMAFPQQVSKGNWFGVKGFREFFNSLGLNDFIMEGGSPGWVRRVGSPILPSPEVAIVTHAGSQEPTVAGSRTEAEVAQLPVDKVPFSERLFVLTEAPYLSVESFQAVFREIDRAIAAGQRSLTGITAAARNALQAEGIKISRNKIGYILKGSMIAGFNLEDEKISANRIGYFFASSIYRQCRAHGWLLTPEEAEEIYRLLGLK